VVTTYVSAIRDRRADDAWNLLDSPKALGALSPPVLSGDGTATESNFRQQVNSNSHGGDKRIRIVDTKTTGDTARVDVEITTFSGEPPIFGPSSHSQTVTFELARRDNGWRITSAPQIWQLS
jgi:hypothetical protein